MQKRRVDVLTFFDRAHCHIVTFLSLIYTLSSFDSSTRCRLHATWVEHWVVCRFNAVICSPNRQIQTHWNATHHSLIRITTNTHSTIRLHGTERRRFLTMIKDDAGKTCRRPSLSPTTPMFCKWLTCEHTGPSNLLWATCFYFVYGVSRLFVYKWRVVTHNWFGFVKVYEASERNLFVQL